jgi:hypothetical protein
MPIVSFWLNAFIPRTVTGYTRTLPAGPHIGKTAIPLPGEARMWPGNTFKDQNCGYLTDQRGFDPAAGASVRMQSWAEVELLGPALIRQTHRSSGTTEVNLATGTQTGFAVANMSRCRFSVPSPSSGPPGGFLAHLTVARAGPAYPIAPPRLPPGVYGSLSVQVTGAAGDPLVGLAADIDYAGTFTISGGGTPGSLNVSFQGMIDAFPAFEAYASFNGRTKEIFRSPPPAGNTVVDLLGAANRPISGLARFPWLDPDALDLYRTSRADFADIMIMLGAREAGCTGVATFDHRAAELDGVPGGDGLTPPFSGSLQHGWSGVLLRSHPTYVGAMEDMW